MFLRSSSCSICKMWCLAVVVRLVCDYTRSQLIVCTSQCVSLSCDKQWHLLTCSLYLLSDGSPAAGLCCSSALTVLGNGTVIRFLLSIWGATLQLQLVFLASEKAASSHEFPAFSLALAPALAMFHLSTVSALFCIFRCWKKNPASNFFLEIVHVKVMCSGRYCYCSSLQSLLGMFVIFLIKKKRKKFNSC